MSKEYYSVDGYGKGIYEEKKSLFIATINHVKTEIEAKEFIENIKNNNKEASHNVYAYFIDNTIQRFNDDGEPNRTGGFPCLEIIKKEKLKYVVCVVTRIFGGTKLGASGLSRAYAKACKEAIHNAGVVKYSCCLEFKVTLDYKFSGKIDNLIDNDYDIHLIDKSFLENIIYHFYIENTLFEKYKKKIYELTEGKSIIEELEKKMYKI